MFRINSIVYLKTTNISETVAKINALIFSSFIYNFTRVHTSMLALFLKTHHHEMNSKSLYPFYLYRSCHRFSSTRPRTSSVYIKINVHTNNCGLARLYLDEIFTDHPVILPQKFDKLLDQRHTVDVPHPFTQICPLK